MGLLADVLNRLQGAAGAERTAGRPWGGRAPDEASYGKAGAPTPDLDALVTGAEIEAVTGGSPRGEPRRNGPDGSEVDLGRHVICEWKLSNGDGFLISLGNCSDAAAARLSMDRVAELERPLAGVGERGLVRVERAGKSGRSEVGVTALKGNFTLSLTHTSASGATDPGPLTALLMKALTRL